MNPRDQVVDEGGPGISLRAQMLRRGIPYGPIWPGSEDHADRGLLFLAYMTSITEQFIRLQRGWANNRSAPPPSDGIDPIIGSSDPAVQNRRPLLRRMPDGGAVRAFLDGRWVHTTGTGIFFAPGIETLRRLLTGP